MSEPAKITIVEGPPPRFEPATDSWVAAISEGPRIHHSARCLLRTMNGAQLIERCQDAWREGREAYLEYRTTSGLTEEALINQQLASTSNQNGARLLRTPFSYP